MEALVKILTENGIEWRGVSLTPSSFAVLRELARRTKIRAEEPVEVARQYLLNIGRGLSSTALTDALNQLQAMRLIRRERRMPQAGHRPANGRAQEEVALTWLSPVLIAAAKDYQAQRRALRAIGKRGTGAFPPPFAIELPLPVPFGSFPSLTSGPDPEQSTTTSGRTENTPAAEIPPSKPNIHAASQGLSSRNAITLSSRKAASLSSHPPFEESDSTDMSSTSTETSASNAPPAGISLSIEPSPLGRQAHFPPAPAGRGGVIDSGMDLVRADQYSTNQTLGKEAALERRVLDSRRLAIWIRKHNGGRDHLTRLVTIRCGADGRYGGGELPLKRHSERAKIASNNGGLILSEWEALFKMVHAKNCKTRVAGGQFIGESLFAGPLDGSRLILLDDVKTAEPLISGHACAILETSRVNFQHLYVADRDLRNAERHLVTFWFREKIGGFSDPGALSGHQAHRWPGSVNRKPGKGNFWTKLIYFGDGKKIDTNVALASVTASSLPSTERQHAPAMTLSAMRALAVQQAGSTDKSASGQDWGQCLHMIASGQSSDAVEAFLTSSALARGKGPAYVRTTMAALAARGLLSGA